MAYIIERTAGITYEEFVQQHIFTPLDINEASFLYSSQVKERLVSGHRRDGESVIPYWHIAYRPFGALNISPDEFTKLLLFMIHRGRLSDSPPIEASNLVKMETPQTTLAAKNGLRHGYGLGIYADDEAQGTLFGHGGTAAGHVAEFRYSSELKLGYLVAINKNSEAALSEISHEIKQFLFDGLPQRSSLEASVKPHVVFEDHAGYYRVSTYRSRGFLPIMNFIGLMKATSHNGKLDVRSWIGLGMTIFATEGDEFFEEGDHEPSVMLMTENGKRYIQTNRWNLEEISPVRYWVTQFVLCFMVLGLLLSVIYSVLFIARVVRGRIQKDQSTKVLLFPFLALVLLILPIAIQVFNLPYLSLVEDYGYVSHVLLSCLFLVFVARHVNRSVILWKKLSLGVVSLSHFSIACFTLYFIWGQ